MAATQLGTRQIGSIQRNDFDITTAGQAVIAKILAGNNMSISQTGVDAGTGDVTMNVKSYLPDSYIAMGGIDLGMTGLYDRNELTNAYYKGGITVQITGAGSVSNPEMLTNANSDFTNITGTDNTTTQIRIIVDTGSVQGNYARGLWQPFLQYRTPPVMNSGPTFYNNIVVETSLDNTTWYGGTGWNTSSFVNNQKLPGLWMPPEATYSPPSITYRYVRFTLTGRVEDSAYPYKDAIWITQIGLRHINAPYARQFVRSDGDTIYGALNVRGLLTLPLLTGSVTDMVTITTGGQLGRQAIPSGGTTVGNRTIYNQSYSASNTFTLAATPTKIYEVRVYNSTTAMNNPVAGYTWTPGTNTVTITDTLQSGDTVYFDVELATLTQSQVNFNRIVSSPSSNITAGSTAYTDYVYICTGTFTITLPTAVGNINRYTVKNKGTGLITLATTSSQLIEDVAASSNSPIASGNSVDLVSDGANWYII